MTLLTVTALSAACDRQDGTMVEEDAQNQHALAAFAGQPQEKDMNTQTATFAAGCFWGVEAAFQKVEGVTATAVGYAGGDVAQPTYKQVCSGKTGHAEVVQVQYDPERVSYADLLAVFWSSHDPTTLNRQGWDVGTQYRSAIFVHTPQQETAAKASRDKLQRSGKFKRDIVTEITPAGPFFRAEEYHQQYLAKQGRSSCGTSTGQ